MKLVGERRALAAIILSFYFIMYLLNALLGGGPTARMLFALAACYGIAAFALISGYFWARWYALGTSLFGVILGALGLWQIGVDEQVLFIGGTHLVATLVLCGESMSKPYDGQTAWRERFHMDESAVHRLGRAVIRAGLSLPFVLVYALQPRQSTSVEIASLVALGLAGVGLRALIRARTYGVLAIAAAGATLVALAAMGDAAHALRPALGGALLLSAAAPFAAPMARFLAGARS
jgi:hypothetical protein